MEGNPSNRQPKGAPPLPCPLCPRSFHAQNALKQHTEALHQHTSSPQVDSSSTLAPTVVEERSKQIEPKPKPPKNIACAACPRRFATQAALKKHRKALHDASLPSRAGTSTVPLPDIVARASDQENGTEDLQSRLEGLTLSPAENGATRVRSDDFIIAAYLKEDMIDDGVQYAYIPLGSGSTGLHATAPIRFQAAATTAEGSNSAPKKKKKNKPKRTPKPTKPAGQQQKFESSDSWSHYGFDDGGGLDWGLCDKDCGWCGHCMDHCDI